MNANEKLIADKLARKGFTIIDKGWPDFLCVKKQYVNGQKVYEYATSGVMCVEVKAGKDKLSDAQKSVHAILKNIGLPVYTIHTDMLVEKRTFNTRRFITHDELRSAKAQLHDLQRKADELQRIIDETSFLLDESDVDRIAELSKFA
jgi:hypothetical protein